MDDVEVLKTTLINTINRMSKMVQTYEVEIANLSAEVVRLRAEYDAAQYQRQRLAEYPPIGDQPGSRVRLRHGFVVECTGFETDAQGNVTQVNVTHFPDSKSGTPGSNNYKVKGNIHWISTAEAIPAVIRLYDHLFTDPHPDSGDKNFLDAINPNSKETITAYLEPCMKEVQAEDRFQFERHGYFIADKVDSKPGKLVFNRTVGLKDSWK